MPGQVLGRLLADVENAQSQQEPRQADVPVFVNGLHNVVRRNLAEARRGPK
jgi:hypothetical protein